MPTERLVGDSLPLGHTASALKRRPSAGSSQPHWAPAGAPQPQWGPAWTGPGQGPGLQGGRRGRRSARRRPASPVSCLMDACTSLSSCGIRPELELENNYRDRFKNGFCRNASWPLASGRQRSPLSQDAKSALPNTQPVPTRHTPGHLPVLALCPGSCEGPGVSHLCSGPGTFVHSSANQYPEFARAPAQPADPLLSRGAPWGRGAGNPEVASRGPKSSPMSESRVTTTIPRTSSLPGQ